MSFLVPTSWPKISEFVQALTGPKCLDVKQVFIGAQVVQAQSSDVHEFFCDKLATLKVDGERHVLILYIDGPQKDVRVLAMRRNGQVLEAPLGTASLREKSPLASKTHGFFTILDCEFLEAEQKWLAFDCIVFRAFPQTVKQDFSARYDLIRRTLQEDFECPNVLIKPYFELRIGEPGYTQFVQNETESRLGIRVENDGLVFQPKRGPYPVGANMNLPQGRGLKWKPACTLDLVPRMMSPKEVIQIHERMYGPVQVHREIYIRPLTTLGLVHTPVYMWDSFSHIGSRSQDFKLPRPLFKLDCVSDFSTGMNAHFTTLALKYRSIPDLPVCVHMDPKTFQSPVVEFEIQTTGTDGVLLPVPRVERSDKASYQANKARTVAGVLWQADENRTTRFSIDDFISDPARAPTKMVLNKPTHVHPVDNPELLIGLDDFILGLDFTGHAEHEFKVVQTKRPRAGNIFPATLDRNYTSASFVDVLHFDRVVKGLCERFQKSEPPVVTTIDFLLEGGLRLTAHERTIVTKSGQNLSFYETDGFVGTRKTHENSVVVHDPELLRNSGYCYRMDTRKETPELFVDHTFLPENSTYMDYLTALKESMQQNPRKRKGAAASNKFNPDAYKGYRLVDRQDFAKETDKDVDVSRLRRVSAEPVRVGETLQVEYRGRVGQFHMATVTRVDPTGTKVDVEYDYAVKSLTNYTSTRHIPLIVDPDGVSTLGLRVKKRRTFDFSGFKVDLTQTRTVQDFRSSERVRLHHLPHRANHCEIEVELLSSIQRTPAFREQLKEVLVAIFSSMQLDENKFLFERVIENPPTPALQEALDAYSTQSGTGGAQGIDPVFVRASSGFGRVVPEADFYATLDAAADAALGPVTPISDPVQFVTPVLDLAILGPYVDTSTARDYIKRRVWKSVIAAGDDGEMHGLMRGLFNLGFNPAWKELSLWAAITQRLRMDVLDRFDIEPLNALVGYLRGTEPLPEETPFLKAGYAFGEAAGRHIYANQGIRAWWDPEEAALAWNDLLDYANRYALELTRDIPYMQWIELAGGDEDDAMNCSEATRALAKLAVIVGAVRIVRDACDQSEVPSELITFSLVDLMTIPERRVYLQTYKPFVFSYLEGVKTTVAF